MLTFVVDCRDVASEAEFWVRYVEAVQPEGADEFGRNVDAFRDAVEKGGPGWPGECALHIVNTRCIRNLDGGLLLQALRDIARDAASVSILLS